MKNFEVDIEIKEDGKIFDTGGIMNLVKDTTIKIQFLILMCGTINTLMK